MIHHSVIIIHSFIDDSRSNVAIKLGSLYIIAKLSMFWKSINSITTSYRQQ